MNVRYAIDNDHVIYVPGQIGRHGTEEKRDGQPWQLLNAAEPFNHFRLHVGHDGVVEGEQENGR